MSGALSLSRGQRSDCDAVEAFLARAIPRDWRSTALPDRAQCQRVLSCDHALMVLARVEDDVIGMAQGWIIPNVIGRGDMVMLDELIVDEPDRGDGVGSRLVAEFVRIARQTGNPPVHIWATTNHPEEPAAKPFLRAGARPADILRQFDWPMENLT